MDSAVWSAIAPSIGSTKCSMLTIYLAVRIMKSNPKWMRDYPSLLSKNFEIATGHATFLIKQLSSPLSSLAIHFPPAQIVKAKASTALPLLLSALKAPLVQVLETLSIDVVFPTFFGPAMDSISQMIVLRNLSLVFPIEAMQQENKFDPVKVDKKFVFTKGKMYDNNSNT